MSENNFGFSVFASAIISSDAYKEQLKSLEGKSPKEKYEALAIEDIRSAAKALFHLYEEGNDGYISIEVDPRLSNSAEATIEEGKRLFAIIGEPNVMIKIPATDAGYIAMAELLSMGIPVNATLVFSPKQAKSCLKAMKHGDRLLDPKLKEVGVTPALTGILNAANIYNIVEHNHTPSIRTLFASTGVKDDTLTPDYYIRELLAPHSINTAPLTTIEAYLKDPLSEPKLPTHIDEIDDYFKILEEKEVDMSAVYEELIQDGLSTFEKAFTEMLDSIK